MPVALLLLLVAALLTQYPATAAPQAQGSGPAAASGLDFEFFKTKVQPILLAKREGHTRCVSCHSKGTPMRFQELSPGATTWNEEQSRMNFRVVQSRVVPTTSFRANSSCTRCWPRGRRLLSQRRKTLEFVPRSEWQTLANWCAGGKQMRSSSR